MFSGIIESVQPVLDVASSDEVLRIFVKRPKEFTDLKLGDSIAVDGVCLTLEAQMFDRMQFALGHETLEVLGRRQSTDWISRSVNLERSLRYGDRMHGHFVSGHVDSVARVTRSFSLGESWILQVQIQKPEILGLLWVKGSITVNGVSLTINQIEQNEIQVCLIPETQNRTNLKNLKEGDLVTIEPDWFAKMMQSKLTAAPAGASSEQVLSQTVMFHEVLDEKNLYQDQVHLNQKNQFQSVMPTKFHTVHELVQDIAAGKMVILIDDEDRENEGDLILAASSVTAELINFMALHARGLICLAMAPEKIDQLGLPQMVSDSQNSSPNKTAFTVSIEAASGVSTGISAADRAHTIKVAASSVAKPSDVRMPGHVFPIRARAGGVLERPGHTEGSVELCKLAGLEPAAVICEIMKSDGEMARVPDLIEFAQQHDLKIGTIQDLIKHKNNLQPVPQAEMDV